MAMSVQEDKTTIAKVAKDVDRPASVSRRALIKSGATAMPMILTLQSGAALARSSNLISASSPDTVDPSDGDTLCLDTTYLDQVNEVGTVYDLGAPATAEVNEIAPRTYFRPSLTQSNTGNVEVTRGTMCQEGGRFLYKDSGFQEINLPKNGIVVSATALMSVATSGILMTYEL